MNRAFAHFFDTAIEYTIGRYKHWRTPNQFKSIAPGEIDWTKNTPETFFAIPPEPPDLIFEAAYCLSRRPGAIVLRLPQRVYVTG